MLAGLLQKLEINLGNMGWLSCKQDKRVRKYNPGGRALGVESVTVFGFIKSSFAENKRLLFLFLVFEMLVTVRTGETPVHLAELFLTMRHSRSATWGVLSLSPGESHFYSRVARSPRPL